MEADPHERPSGGIRRAREWSGVPPAPHQWEVSRRQEPGEPGKAPFLADPMAGATDPPIFASCARAQRPWDTSPSPNPRASTGRKRWLSPPAGRVLSKGNCVSSPRRKPGCFIYVAATRARETLVVGLSGQSLPDFMVWLVSAPRRGFWLGDWIGGRDVCERRHPVRCGERSRAHAALQLWNRTLRQGLF
jgi:hypothetical protein